MLYFHSKHKTNRVTIGGEFCEDGSLCLSAARCGDKDNFCRQTGRTKVDTRFNIKRHCISIQGVEKNSKTFYNFANKLADFINNNADFKKKLKVVPVQEIFS
jgi:hypothetical protein